MLVCTKNRASYERRLAEYAKDIEWMASMVERAPVEERPGPIASDLQRLRDALSGMR